LSRSCRCTATSAGDPAARAVSPDFAAGASPAHPESPRQCRPRPPVSYARGNRTPHPGEPPQPPTTDHSHASHAIPCAAASPHHHANLPEMAYPATRLWKRWVRDPCQSGRSRRIRAGEPPEEVCRTRGAGELGIGVHLILLHQTRREKHTTRPARVLLHQSHQLLPLACQLFIATLQLAIGARAHLIALGDELRVLRIKRRYIGAKLRHVRL